MPTVRSASRPLPSPRTDPPRSLTTTLAPCAASSSAWPRPMPCPAPSRSPPSRRGSPRPASFEPAFILAYSARERANGSSAHARAVGRLVAQVERAGPATSLPAPAAGGSTATAKRSRSVSAWAWTTSSTRSRPAGVSRTITLRRSRRPARSTKPARLQPIDAVGDRAGRHHRLAHQLAGGQLVRLARAAQRGQHVVHPVLEAEAGEVLGEPAVEQPGQPRDPADHPDRRDVEVGPTAAHCSTIAVDGVASVLWHIDRSYAMVLTVIILILR